MLQLSDIKLHTEEIKKRLAIRAFGEPEILDKIVHLDDERIKVQNQLNNIQSELNNASKQIGQLMKDGKTEEANEYKSKTIVLKESTDQLHETHRSIEQSLYDLLVQVPNAPHPSVPTGNCEDDNEILKTSGDIPTLHADAKPHWDLAKQYNLFDLELGVKLTGAGFPVYRGKGAKLQRALISFFLDCAIEAGYEEIIPPLLVSEETAFATGQLPDKEGQMYEMKHDPYFLIPTAEVPITNVLRNMIVSEDQLPIKMAGYTPCFRREAGSYGKEVRGLNRVHQFDKVEIVQVTLPEKSYETLDKMVAYVESLIIQLGLPYRIAKLCGGDLGYAAAMTYDMEVYSAAQKRWLEVSSISNFETFQSNRLKLRYKNKDKKNVLVHTLNGSAIALPRIVASLLENNQTPDGIVIPEVLRKYTGFDMIK